MGMSAPFSSSLASMVNRVRQHFKSKEDRAADAAVSAFERACWSPYEVAVAKNYETMADALARALSEIMKADVEPLFSEDSRMAWARARAVLSAFKRFKESNSTGTS
jgi:hypothetical protein